RDVGAPAPAEAVAEPRDQLEATSPSADNDDFVPTLRRRVDVVDAQNRPGLIGLLAGAHWRPRSAAGRYPRWRVQVHRCLLEIEHALGLVGVVIRFLVEYTLEALLIERLAPFGHHQRRHAVADEVGEGARFGHETVDAEDQRQACNRHVADG